MGQDLANEISNDSRQGIPIQKRGWAGGGIVVVWCGWSYVEGEVSIHEKSPSS
jgi:hypothetical protein